jgi:hypothetical protein
MTLTWHQMAMGCALLLAVSACAKRPVTPAAAPSPPTYAEQIQERVQEASERELHELRYNPGLCGCPPFELELQGRWHRVTFDVVDDSHPVLVELRMAVERDESGGELGRYLIQGKLEDRVATCGQGAIFLTLDPSAYGAPEPPETPEPVEDESTSGDTPSESDSPDEP